MNYKIIVNRHTAALYLSWEFGVKRAVELLAALDGAEYIDLNQPGRNAGISKWHPRRGYGVHTESDAHAACAKIEAMALYQAGRLGYAPATLCYVA